MAMRASCPPRRTQRQHRSTATRRRRWPPLPWYAPDGTARDFTYVDDAVAGIVAALERGRACEAYNLSGWRSVELGVALETREEEFGCCASLDRTAGTGAEARVTQGCWRKSAAELGYRPRTDLATG